MLTVYTSAAATFAQVVLSTLRFRTAFIKFFNRASIWLSYALIPSAAFFVHDTCGMHVMTLLSFLMSSPPLLIILLLFFFSFLRPSLISIKSSLIWCQLAYYSDPWCSSPPLFKSLSGRQASCTQFACILPSPYLLTMVFSWSYRPSLLITCLFASEDSLYTHLCLLSSFYVNYNNLW